MTPASRRRHEPIKRRLLGATMNVDFSNRSASTTISTDLGVVGGAVVLQRGAIAPD